MNLKDLVDACKAIAKEHGNVCGNISLKDGNQLWIKASGAPLAEADEESFIIINREKLRTITLSSYPENVSERENRFRHDIEESIEKSKSLQYAPVDTALHNLLNYRYVAHFQPATINGLLCSRNAKNVLKSLFGENIFFVQYTDPGYSLYMKIGSDLVQYRQTCTKDPELIFIESNGIIISSDSSDNIEKIFRETESTIIAGMQPLPETIALPYNPLMDKVLPALRMLISSGKPQVVRFRHNSLVQQYYNSQQEFHKISLPLSPSVINRCRTRFLYIEQVSTPERIIDSFRYQLPNFINEYGHAPGIIVIKGIGVFSFSDSYKSAEDSLDAFEDHIRISHHSSQRGGSRFLTPEQVAFISKQESEIRKCRTETGRVQNKITVLAGTSKGFGAEIATALFRLGSNIIIADNDDMAGSRLVDSFNKDNGSNLAVFVKTDLSEALSVKEMISSIVKEFGGIDLFIYNAGLPVDSFENKDPEGFKSINDAYYKGYYLCTRYASEIIKIQNSENPDHFCDIIHINPLQCFKNENLNIIYSGVSSACTGLTRSFAIELAPFRIKVNSVCPGNFFEDQFWTDTQKGLFIQYLKAGKIPGARTIEDVKQFFINRVPLKRGCTSQDLLKAILYIVDQEYETGQAINVSGGFSVC